MDEARTEQPTTRKLARARQHGMVARSPGLTAAASLLGLLAALAWLGPRLLLASRELMLAGLERVPSQGGAASPLASLVEPIRALVSLAALLLLAIAFSAFLGGLLQVGPMLAPGAVVADPRRLDPVAWLTSLLSPERLAERASSLLQLLVLLGVGGYVLAHGMRGWLTLSLGGPHAALGRVAVTTADLALVLGCTGALLGTADLVYRRVRHAQRLRMSRRELELELRETHGPRELREQRVRLQREALTRAALLEVEHASVLLLDGSGRALALAFDAADPTQRSPRVMLKVQGALCERVRAAAERAGVGVRLQPS
ncbi:MAG: EscU/YscU/HrcU family type III secretion system export apparatus switch protein, partial [Polyangiales bacterium]